MLFSPYRSNGCKMPNHCSSLKILIQILTLLNKGNALPTINSEHSYLACI